MRPVTLLLAAGWLVGVSVAVHAQTPKKYAVLVGVNAYQHEKLPALRFAVNDATSMADVLRRSGYEVALLTDEAGRFDPKAAPNRVNIETTLKTVLDKSRQPDTVIICLAGHGVQFDGGKDGFYCPTDAKPFPERADSMISLGKLYQDLDQSFAGVKVLLVDACRDDPTASRGSRGVDADSAPRPPRGVAALFSCSAGERAFEHDSLKHGVFFHYVLEGLKGGVKNNDGEVTFLMLAEYVQGNVSKATPKIIGGVAKQSPNLKADLSSASPVLLRVAGNLAANLKSPLVTEGENQFYGRGVPKEIPKALTTFRQAAQRGDAEAMYYAGYCVHYGFGEPINVTEALEWYRKAAARGEARAMVYLGTEMLLSKVPGIEDPIEGRRLINRGLPELSRLADSGDPLAQNRLGYLTYEGLVLTKDVDEARNWFRKAADQFDAGAQFNLGRMYADGGAGLKNEKEAVKWYRKAADQNYAGALYSLGVMYADGRGVAKDEVVAVEWYRKAADQNYTHAQYKLGWTYDMGRGVSKDEAEAVKWYRKAAEQNHSGAQNNLAAKYAAGRGVAKDDVEAVKWFRKAAEQNVSVAQTALGRMYREGRGVAKDDMEALKWYRKAASQNQASAQNSLGIMYQNGDGVGKDDAEAVNWYRKAAEQNLAVAQLNLGKMYLTGRGVLKDESEAIKWFRKAAAQGNEKAIAMLKDLGQSP